MFGTQGRAKRPAIDSVRELTAADIAGLERAKNQNPVKVHRDSHHMVARLFAMGLRPGEVATETGYSLGRISTLAGDPAFQELIAYYRNMVNQAFADRQDEYYQTVSANRRLSARLINDKLSEVEPEEISFRELVLIHSDAADRTGYPKRTVALNVNADFASLLDKAIQRSQGAKLIEGTVSDQPALGLPAGDGGEQTPSQESAPQPIRRRA